MLNVVPDVRPSTRPEIASNRQSPATPPSRQPGIGVSIAVMLNIMSLAVAAGMIVLLYFISQSVRQVASLENRLGELTRFETRLSGQVETVNQGFHSQFDELNARLSALTSQAADVEKQIKALARENRALAAAGSGQSGLSGDGWADAEPELVEEAAETILHAPAPQDANPPPAAPSNASPAQFQRIETPDGKVTYSRVR